MIHIKMIRQDTHHPDKRRRHQGRASCEVTGRCFETVGPALLYKLATLLWLHGHGGAAYEVWDDVSPFGKPGGLAMRGRVRNWTSFLGASILPGSFLNPKFTGLGNAAWRCRYFAPR